MLKSTPFRSCIGFGLNPNGKYRINQMSNFRWTALTCLTLLLAVVALAAIAQAGTVSNVRVRVTDEVGTFNLTDTDQNIFNDSVTIAPDVAVGFNIDPIDPTMPIAIGTGTGNSAMLTLTNVVRLHKSR